MPIEKYNMSISEEGLVSESLKGCCENRTRLEKVLVVLLVLSVLAVAGLLAGLILTANDRDQIKDSIAATANNGGGTASHASTSTSSMTSQTTPEPTASADFCLTPGCIHASARLMTYMNDSADPCEDFYEYACGMWEARHVIPEDKSSYGVFTKVRDELQILLKGIMDETNMNEFEFSNTTKWAKEIYEACLDEDSIDELGAAPAQGILDELGGWTLGMNGSPANKLSLTDLLIRLRSIDSSYIMGMWVGADSYNTSKRIIYLDQPGLGLPSREYYFPKRKAGEVCVNVTADVSTTTDASSVTDDGVSTTSPEENIADNIQECHPKDNRTDDELFWQDDNIVAYHKYLSELARLMGVENQTLADEQLRKIIELEVKIANATVPMSQRRNKTAMYNPVMMENLSADYPNIEWSKYFAGIFESALPEEDRPKPEEMVIVRQKEYFEEFNEILGGADEETMELLKNYALIRTVKRMTGSLSKAFRNVRLQYSRVLFGVEVEEARWKQCLSYTNDNLGFAVGKLYVKEYFDETAKQTAKDMIRRIRTSFDEILDEVEWLDDETRSKTKEKAEAISENIAYPDFLNNATALDDEYEDLSLEVETKGHFKYVKKLWTYSGAWDLKHLRKPVDKTKFPGQIDFPTVAVVNAFYSPDKNAITFPAGILQPPFFTPDGPKSLNYGAIGSVIGHEITHGFDDQGRQTDKEGNLNQWWSPEVVQNFVEKAKCIVDQYSDYYIEAFSDKFHLNGTNTQGENIADNGGLKESFRAYKKWVADNGVEKPLPGLQHISHDQLFFMNFANVWCGSYTDQAVVLSVRTGVHSPGKFRVLGTVSNSEYFAEAFQCKLGSAMNPEKKCKVW